MTSNCAMLALAAVFLSASGVQAQPFSLVATAPSVELTTTEKPVLDTDAYDVRHFEFSVRSDIQFRYARTRVENLMRNPDWVARRAYFHMYLPDKAFISNFSMLIGDQEYVAQVKRKEEAQETYDEAVEQGRTAGLLVNQYTKFANSFTVMANLEPGAEVRFALTYEELLERKLGRYEHSILLDTNALVDCGVRIEVHINESRPITHVRVPRPKVNPKSSTSLDDNPIAQIHRDPADPTAAVITYEGNSTTQKEFEPLFSLVPIHFIVQYDVDVRSDHGDIQLIDGYFVHFFAPDNLATFPKHVVFVLDVSGSMRGEKLDQLKDAMVTILDELTDRDYLNILTFSDEIYHWAPDLQDERPAYQAKDETRNEALFHTLRLEVLGNTNINGALLDAIKVVRTARASGVLPDDVRSMVIFLTDGEATAGVTDGTQITANVAEANKWLDVPVYGLAFGQAADFDLVKNVSLENGAFARRIFAGSSATIQLENFFADVGGTLLSNVNFSYVGDRVKKQSVTDQNFNGFDKGTDIVVAGRIDDGDVGEEDEIEVIVTGHGPGGQFEERIRICLKSLIDDPTSSNTSQCIIYRSSQSQASQPRSTPTHFVERLWAFLSIKKYLAAPTPKADVEKKKHIMASHHPAGGLAVNILGALVAKVYRILKIGEPDDGGPTELEISNEKLALELALRYNFVTPVTSLIVIRPDADGNGQTADPVHSETRSWDPPPTRPGYQCCPSPYYYYDDWSRDSDDDSDDSNNLYTDVVDSDVTSMAGDRFYDKMNCSGRLVLFDGTYLRGGNVTVDDDVPDLSELDFDDAMKSALVEGDCCWDIFVDPLYAGDSLTFKAGAYKKPSKFVRLVKKASSVKKLLKC